jgi:hypothetical protein
MQKKLKTGTNCMVRDSHGLLFGCKIVGVKNSYGKTRYKVAPIMGKGTAWVENVLSVSATV